VPAMPRLPQAVCQAGRALASGGPTRLGQPSDGAGDGLHEGLGVVLSTGTEAVATMGRGALRTVRLHIELRPPRHAKCKAAAGGKIMAESTVVVGILDSTVGAEAAVNAIVGRP